MNRCRKPALRLRASGIAAALAASLAGAPPGVPASELTMAPLAHSPLSLAQWMQSDRPVAALIAPPPSAHRPDEGRAEHWLLPAASAARAEILELAPPAAVLADGRPRRPHRYLGFESETLRQWMRAAGFDSQRCMAPMLRLSTRLSQGRPADSAGLSGNFSVMMRCDIR
ncbi:MAG: hypothetical protein ACK5YV_17785 [Betaproteobacteria bacterium]